MRKLGKGEKLNLICELCYEDGQEVECRSILEMAEGEPTYNSTKGEWLVRANIKDSSRRHDNRKFALRFEVSNFEQRAAGFVVDGVLTRGMFVVGRNMSFMQNR